MEENTQPLPEAAPLPSTRHTDLQSEPHTFAAIPGEYHLIETDAHGNEIPGTDFSISARQYQKTYAHLPHFKLKKKP